MTRSRNLRHGHQSTHARKDEKMTSPFPWLTTAQRKAIKRYTNAKRRRRDNSATL